MSSCLQTLSKVAKVKVLIQQCGVRVFHKILLSFFYVDYLTENFSRCQAEIQNFFNYLIFFYVYQQKKCPIRALNERISYFLKVYLKSSSSF